MGSGEEPGGVDESGGAVAGVAGVHFYSQTGHPRPLRASRKLRVDHVGLLQRVAVVSLAAIWGVDGWMEGGWVDGRWMGGWMGGWVDG